MACLKQTLQFVHPLQDCVIEIEMRMFHLLKQKTYLIPRSSKEPLYSLLDVPKSAAKRNSGESAPQAVALRY